MITIISAILGFAGSMVPEILATIRDHQDRQHEITLLKMQMEQQRLGHVQRLDEIAINADVQQSRALYKTYHTGIRWVDALNGTVRPVLAYAFFLLFATIKLLQFSELNTPLPWSYETLWAEEDQAIFAAIIAFYFGQRAFGKVRR